MIEEYRQLLEDEIFKSDDRRGRIRTALTILTDMLIELNALEIYYQKPGTKSLAPPEITTLRSKIQIVKELLHASMEVEH